MKAALVSRVLDVDFGWLVLGPRAARVADSLITEEPEKDHETPIVGGRKLLGVNIPLMYVEDPRLMPKSKRAEGNKHILSHRPCSKKSFGVYVWDGRNAPKYCVGDIIIIDPMKVVNPGNMVLIRNAGTVVFGRYHEHDETVNVVALADGWRAIQITKSNIIGVMTEHSSSHEN